MEKYDGRCASWPVDPAYPDPPTAAQFEVPPRGQLIEVDVSASAADATES